MEGRKGEREGEGGRVRGCEEEGGKKEEASEGERKSWEGWSEVGGDEREGGGRGQPPTAGCIAPSRPAP